VELEVLDEAGRLCVRDNPLIHFNLSGAGKILGIENGDLADLSPYREPRRRAYRGRLIVYALRPAAAPGETRLEASAAGFAPVSITL
jgi:beta-galactosidase